LICGKKAGDIRSVRFVSRSCLSISEHQLFEETVFKDIAFGPKNMGLNEDEIKQRVLAAMDFVGLSYDLLDNSPFELSGGQKRKVAIAGVIAMQPEVLVLDEPTAGLDPRARDDLLLKIKKYHFERKSTVILVSHSMEDVAKTVDKILVMKTQNYRFKSVKDIFEDYHLLFQ
jgi:energy-coupling factor transport system ATP-binding protein